jgi:hypothetical protein
MNFLLQFLLLLRFIYTISAFRAVILPGFGNAQQDYTKFVQVLSSRGVTASVVPIERIEWLNIIKSIINPRFWKDECIPDELFKFYYDKVDLTVRQIVNDNNDTEGVVLVCHSAGGWLARGLLRDNNWYGSITKSSDLVQGIVTLGSPHYPPVKGSDMTRGALKFISTTYPGSYLKDELFYISVAGTVVTGNPGTTSIFFYW